MRPGRLTPRGWPPVRAKTQARGQVQELRPVLCRSWCRSCGFEVRRILTFLGQQCDHRADVDLLAWLHINGGDGAVVVNGKLHGGLVGLHISNNVS